MTSHRKELEFVKLAGEVRVCNRCPRMANSIRVIGPASGSIDAPILIIGEAPGRLGADASAIPFHGDKAGENFESLLEQVGLSRHDCFITNAALCNPKDEKGNNSTPSKLEIQNCSDYLKRQIDLVEPRTLFYLAEYEFYKRNNRRMTSAYIVRQKDGPYVFEMHIKKLRKALKSVKVWEENNRLMLRATETPDLFSGTSISEFDDVLKHVSDKYGRFSDHELKRVVYLTSPMKQMLRKEKGLRESTFNRPLDFSVIKAAM
jgi:uracil-DNA glycosylase family 4